MCVVITKVIKKCGKIIIGCKIGIVSKEISEFGRKKFEIGDFLFKFAGKKWKWEDFLWK